MMNNENSVHCLTYNVSLLSVVSSKFSSVCGFWKGLMRKNSWLV